MRSHYSHPRRTGYLCFQYCAGLLALLMLATGCSRSARTEQAVQEELDLTQSGPHTSGAWTYTYSISSPGTRSEGYHGSLSYGGIEVPAPIHINDFYETPWGRLHWVGQPVVLFGVHGWMPKPLAREPLGRPLIDPGTVHSGRFVVYAKILAPEEFATPDRLEKDPEVLEALKPFALTEAHIQSNWFPLGSDPITLHDTKRWGTLTVCRSDLKRHLGPTLEFACTTGLEVDTSPKPASLAELMEPPALFAKPGNVSLNPQVDAIQPVKCTLSSFVGEPLVLYLVCQVRDQGPKQPWTSPGMRIFETPESGTTNLGQTAEE